MKQPISNKPPKLPINSNTQILLVASRNQRIRAGLIDHFIDSTIWVWFFLIAMWTALHLQTPIDAQSFFIIICTNFSTSMSLIGLLFIGDLLLCVHRGQSLGQMINGIYKTSQISQAKHIKNDSLDVLKLWLHSLVSRCLGLPLLFVCLLLWLSVDPIITPIHLQNFSLIDPEGSYLLMTFLLKIIGFTLLLFGLFLPFGLGFVRNTLPTWYDQLLSVNIVQKIPKSHL
jgi:hypothetical protein